MKLQYYKGKVPNFGDDLNDWMWRRILPEGILDEDEKELFVGIGSILNSHLPKEPKKYVFGSGFGGYGRPPEVTDEKWDIRFVRGPDTANLINAPAEKAVCDSAILLREVRDLPEPATNIGTALIPHFESLENGYWEQVAEKAGFTLIDPRGDVETILSQIRGADLVITEAMHGAIVADALRIPWIGLLPVNPAHHMKWHDWSKSLNIKLDAQFMPPTSLLEWYINKTKGLKYYDGRAKRYNESKWAKPLNDFLIKRSALRLKRLKNITPQLSDESVIVDKTRQAKDIVDIFVEEQIAKRKEKANG